MAEFDVHRLRFGNWVPSAIKSIAVDRSYSNKVAIGREDGEIEILSSVYGFAADCKISGSADFKLQALAWSKFHSEKCERGRLFGISLKGFLFEVNLSNLSLGPLHDTYGGAAWSLAASPRSSTLAVGGEDGVIRLFRYSSSDQLEYAKSLPTSGSRVLSLAFHPEKAQLFVGCSDGTVRCMDENTGRVLFRMTGDVKHGVFTPSIWSLAVLRDSTVVTGDSRGQIQIWDGTVGVLSASFLQHTADVLCIAVSDDESKIFASGVDGKVVCIQRPVMAKSGSSAAELLVDDGLQEQWVYTHSHRVHTHDVYALAVISRSKHARQVTSSSGATCSVSSLIFPGKTQSLLSGSMDARLALYAVEDFDRVRPQWLPIVPANELIAHSKDYSTIAMRHNQHVDIWRIAMQSLSPEDAQGKSLSEHCSLALRLKSAGQDHIHSIALTPDGSLLAVATSAETKLWNLQFNDQCVGLTKIAWPESLLANKKSSLFSLRSLTFSPDGKYLAGWHAGKNSVLLFSIQSSKQQGEISVKFAFSLGLEVVDRTADDEDVDAKLAHIIRKIAISSDNAYMAVSNAAKEVIVYDIQKRSKVLSFGVMAAPVSDISFFASKGESHLLSILFANNSVMIVDCATAAMHSWSIRNSEQKRASIPHDLRFALAGLALDPKKKSRMFVYGQLQSMFLDLNEEVPSQGKVILPAYALVHGSQFAERRVSFSADTKGTKRGRDVLEDDGEDVAETEDQQAGTSLRGDPSTAANCALIETYRNILHMGFSDNNTLIVIENPWSRITELMPDTIARKRYGT